jgi:hypothetical protein
MARGEPTKTIAHARAGGETALNVHCLGFGCYHQAVKTFEELRQSEREGDADLPSGERHVGIWQIAVDGLSETQRNPATSAVHIDLLRTAI